MYTAKLLFFTIGIIVLTILLLMKARLWIISKNSGELLLMLKPKYGYGKREAMSNLLLPFVFLGIILVDRIGVNGFNGFKKYDILFVVFIILLAFIQFIDTLTTIQFREKGIFTKMRFIPWDIVNSYEEIKKEYKGRIVDCLIKVNILSRKKVSKFIIHKDLYEYGMNIETVLSEKNIGKILLVKND